MTCGTCRKSRVNRQHWSTAAHKRAARPIDGTDKRGRPGWMIALRDIDHQYDEAAEAAAAELAWPSYAPIGRAPLVGDHPLTTFNSTPIVVYTQPGRLPGGSPKGA